MSLGSILLTDLANQVLAAASDLPEGNERDILVIAAAEAGGAAEAVEDLQPIFEGLAETLRAVLGRVPFGVATDRLSSVLVAAEAQIVVFQGTIEGPLVARAMVGSPSDVYELVLNGVVVSSMRASVAGRENTLAELLTLAGAPGEVSFPNDFDMAIVRHNGNAGEAVVHWGPGYSLDIVDSDFTGGFFLIPDGCTALNVNGDGDADNAVVFAVNSSAGLCCIVNNQTGYQLIIDSGFSGDPLGSGQARAVLRCGGSSQNALFIGDAVSI